MSGMKPQRIIGRRKAAGFTLVEMMIVTIIIAALAGMVLPRIWPASDAAKTNIAAGDIANITVALQLYRLHHNRFPSESEGLDVLLESSRVGGWDGPFLENEPIDPWNRPYRYRYPGRHNPNGFDLWSAGVDGQDGTTADITNWK